jgi:hypothetical protein
MKLSTLRKAHYARRKAHPQYRAAERHAPMRPRPESTRRRTKEMKIEIGTRVRHPEIAAQVGTVVELGAPDSYQAGRARVKWDDRHVPASTRVFDGHVYPARVDKGKRTWIAFARLTPSEPLVNRVSVEDAFKGKIL